MLKKVFFLTILMLFAVSLGLPASQAEAGGANQVDFTATSVNFCEATGFTGDLFCNPGELVYLPNGKVFIVGYQTIMKFTATDPRWNADCYFTADPYPPSSFMAFPATGSFVCKPYGIFPGGWWEGSVQQVFHPDKYSANWHGKGYGTLDRLEVISYNTLSNYFDDVAPVITDVGTIIELPGYVEP